MISRYNTVLTAVFCCLTAWFTPLAANADYLTPEKAGFHNCVLIYHANERSADALKPYVVRMREGKPTSDWLFDAFLFLVYNMPDGTDTETGATTKEHWLWQLDTWFNQNRDVAALDQAVNQVSSELGKPATKRKVILAIPWPNPSVKEFGDVDGDGLSENLTTLAGRDKVMSWYINEARNRFEKANFQNLELWGFYWMRERIDVNPESVRSASRLVHEAGNKLLWIPWYRSAGWQNAYSYGFDAVIMQPNYAFKTWLDGGNIKSSRLDAAAQDCRDKGFGFEIENRSNPPNKTDGHVFIDYLAYGDSKRLGYQKAVNGFFLDVLFLENTYFSKKPDLVSYYEALADYVCGKPVVLLDDQIPLTWTTHEGVYTAEGKTDPLHKTAFVDITYSQDRLSGWRGIVTAEFVNGNVGFKPAGWTARLHNGTDKVDCISVPVESSGDKLRIKVTTLSGTFNPKAILRVNLETTGPSSERNIALNKPYVINPEPTIRDYPDTGSKLTDGVVDLKGFASGQSVGWMSDTVHVQIDLGQLRKVIGIDISVLGGGKAAVNWPKRVETALSSEAPVHGDLSGTGPMPKNMVLLTNKEVKIINRRSADDASGTISLSTKKAVSTRYITLSIEPDIWLMLSELTVRGTGGKIKVGSYRFSPQPTSQAGKQYVDDGRKLTDGVSIEASNSGMVGWTGAGNRDITVDLGRSYRTQMFSVFVLSDLYSSHSMAAPAKVEFMTSMDGKDWSTPRPAAKMPQGQETNLYEFTEYTVTCEPETTTRYVRTIITPSSDERTLVSEIVVR